jgi:UMF1 family MFS transporter
VLPAQRSSSLVTIIGMVFAAQAVLLVLAYVLQGFFKNLAETLDTRRSILLSLLVYSAIAIWGFFLDSTIEYWFLAWMVAVVQGGSQALSRSLYASMCPTSKSGEFFGFFSIMEKFASIIGPLLFAFAALTFGSSRPAILSLIALFIIGGYLLTRVNIEEGRRVAQEDDAALLKA